MKKMSRMANRIFSLFLALVMLCTVQDITAFAAEDAETALKSETLEMSGEERYNADYYAEPELRFPKNQKSLYSQARTELSLEEYVVAALENHETWIDVSAYNISPSAAGREYFKILNNNPQLFYVMGTVSMTYEGNQVKYYWPEYLAGKEETMQMKKELETAVLQVLEQVDESMDAVQKALVVHDYLVQNCEYDQEGLTAGYVPDSAYTAYSALVEGMAVCEGYAKAYAYIMKHKLGIPCTVVSSESMEHAWNMIEIDGTWYHVDVTWDDPVWDCIGRVHHDYFLLSDEAISQNSPNAATGNGNHYGWTPYDTADSDRYDREFWRGVESAISYYNGAWYYSGYESASRTAVLRKKADLFAENAETVYQTSPWQASGQSFYSASFMYLAQADGKLYFNTSTKIMQMDADGKVQVFYEPDDLAGKQIFGFTAQDGGFLYAPNDAPPLGKQSDIRRYSPGGEAPPSEAPDDPSETPSPSEDPDAEFWAYVDEQKQELQKYKDTVIAELNDKYASKVGSYHYTDFNDELQRLIDNAIDEINRVVLGVYYEPVSGDKYIVRTLRDCVETIHVNLTRRKAKIDEQVNLFDWSDLVDVWKAAKEELDNYKNPKDYRAAQQKELEAAIEAGKAAIDEAKKAAYVDGNPTSHDPVSAKKEVEKALKAAKANIDKIKTDAQLKQEETADKTDNTDNTDKTNKTDKTGKTEATSAPKAGTSFKKGQHTYKVLKAGSTVAFTKTKSTAKSISVPATITYGGIKYKVTEVSGNAFKNNKKVTTVKLGSNIITIGVSAFQGCKKLKTITVSSKKLKIVGKKAFSGIYTKAKVKVPSGKKKAYKKLLKGKGLSKKAKIV